VPGTQAHIQQSILKSKCALQKLTLPISCVEQGKLKYIQDASWKL
jgi:hypothetical protein